MKIKRYKKVNRALRFYELHYKFRKPYQILIDGTICVAALKNKINLKEQLTKYLDGDPKFLTTSCIVQEIDVLGLFGASLVVKQFAVRSCGHEQPVTGSQCILSMIGEINSSRYIVASQDRELQHVCRGIAGVPLLYLHLTTPTLELPSQKSQEKAAVQSRETCALNVYDRDTLMNLKGPQTVPDIRPKKKRAKGPNPLSCKRKKKLSGEKTIQEANLRKRKSRKKNRKISVLEG